MSMVKRGEGAPPTTTKPHKKSRRSNNTLKTRPAFVTKLWSMVNDQANQAHIKWSDDGESFQVIGREQFERLILPKYFKHSNFASFVRQLNMYGWHKMQDVTSGAMNTQNQEEIWQFKSPNFIRGREELLDNIVRNKSGKGGSDDEQESMDIQHIIQELALIRENQRAISEDLLKIQRDNQLLWAENIQSRERNQKHAQTLERIMRFLATLYGGNNRLISEMMGNINSSPPRIGGQLLLTNDATNNNNNNGNTNSQISELNWDPDPTASSPKSKQRRIESISSSEKSSATPDLTQTTVPPLGPNSLVTSTSHTSPSSLFPELQDTTANTVPHHQEPHLENIAQQLNEQDQSLHSVENWLMENNPNYYEDNDYTGSPFDVNEYLDSNGGGGGDGDGNGEFDTYPVTDAAQDAAPVTANGAAEPAPNNTNTVPYNPVLEPITDSGEVSDQFPGGSGSLKRPRPE